MVYIINKIQILNTCLVYSSILFPQLAGANNILLGRGLQLFQVNEVFLFKKFEDHFFVDLSISITAQFC